MHWKITHNIYPTNILLHKMGLSNTENCNLCEEKDYIEHFFCECPRVNRLWKRVELEVSEVLGGEIIQLTTRQKLFGVVRGDLSNYFINKVNHLILVAKMCISKYVYGDYNDIIRLFEYELALRKECDHWLNYDSPSCQPGGNVWVYVKPWPCFVCAVDNKKKKKKKKKTINCMVLESFVISVAKTATHPVNPLNHSSASMCHWYVSPARHQAIIATNIDLLLNDLWEIFLEKFESKYNYFRNIKLI